MGKPAHVCTSCSLQQLNIALECELKSLHHYSSYSGLCFHNAVLGITAHQHPPTPLPLHKSRHIFKAVVVLKELISSQAPLDVLVTIPCRFLGNAFFDLTNQLVEFVKMRHSTNKRKIYWSFQRDSMSNVTPAPFFSIILAPRAEASSLKVWQNMKPETVKHGTCSIQIPKCIGSQRCFASWT